MYLGQGILNPAIPSPDFSPMKVPPMKKYGIPTLLLLLLAPTILRAQQPLSGNWEGSIQIMGQRLAIIVHFENDSTATIDIPQQNAAGLRLTNVRYQHPNMRFELPAGPGLATFEGVLKDEEITGEFKQAGVAGTFRLTRGEPSKEEKIAEPPPPYGQEEVVFSDDTVKLAGTLTLPPEEGRHPAVIMITGSGAQNRDEELFGFKPFKIIADYFTRNGIAVLRYDDRGVGGSSGNTSQSTTRDFASDALAALRYLQTRPDINPRQIGLCGHSEGGIVAPLAASRSKDVAFIILISGPALDGERILLAQAELIMRADSASEKEIKDALALNKRIYDVVREGKNPDEFRAELEQTIRNEINDMKPERRQAIKDPDAYVNARVEAMVKQVETPWFRYFLTYDPAQALERAHCPVLALFGERDLQVPAEMDKTAMEKALRKGENKDFTLKILPKANHLFLTAVTGSPSEYASMKKEFVPGFLETMTSWILKHVTIVK